MTIRFAPVALCGGALLFTSSLPAIAADLGRGPAVSPEPFEYHEPMRAGRWEGFYLGIAYAYATSWTGVDGDRGGFDIDTSGNVGSVFGGYNWQVGNGIFGLEADIGTGTMSGSENRVSTDLNYFGALRARLGYLVNPGFLVYGTAGLAYADFDFKAFGDAQSETFVGYQAGAGTELKFSDPWSLRLEYLYTDLGSERLSHNTLSNAYDPDFHTLRAGLSYRF